MRGLKRAFDILCALLVLSVFLPLLLIIGVLVKLNLGSPIFFKQERIGYKNSKFLMYKFRTMKDLKDNEGNLLDDSKRITKFGKFLRSSSLDELPEFLNVLKGEMSLIGPRPLLIEYLPLYNKEQIKRHDLLPGLTGYAQVNGRNSLSWTERFKLDVWYVENWSFKLDIKIFFLTIFKVLKRDGISAVGEVTMSKFDGVN